jgi:hypothetical protein
VKSLVLHLIYTMNLTQRVLSFSALGDILSAKLDAGSFDSLLSKAYFENQWFTKENSRNAIFSIISDFLNKSKIEHWLDRYNLPENNESPKTIGIVMAGNIPLVGWHDLMSTLITGNKALIKLSTKDTTLMKLLIDELIAIDADFKEIIQITDQPLKDFDAIVATGSNNTLRYFEYYFGKYPHILRKNRNSIAILTGNESDSELVSLGNDIMAYFGLGCRNVSNLYLPLGYNFNRFFEVIEPWNKVLEHNKYANNYMYNKSILLLNKEKHLDNGFLLLRESKALSTPVSVLNYQYYHTIEEVKSFLQEENDNLQCIVAHPGIIDNTVNFGETQNPQLWDYADGVDVVEFLNS